MVLVSFSFCLSVKLLISPSNLNDSLTGRVFSVEDFWGSHHGSLEMNLTSIHEDMGSIPGLAQWVKDLALP